MYRERPSEMLPAVLWRSRVDRPGLTRVLPDGCLDIIATGSGDLFVAGPDTTAHLTAFPPGTEFTAVRFRPGAGPAVLGVPADELTDRRVPLDALWPAARVRALAGLLARAERPAAALEAAVAAVPLRADLRDPLAAGIARRLRAGTDVAALAATLGLSERQLRRRSHAAFGYGPKTLARILRMHRALALVRAGTPTADAAAGTGYADQPHLSREVRALAGAPLRDLVA